MTAVSRRRSIELRLRAGRWSRSLTRIRFPRRYDVGAPYDKRVPCGSTWKSSLGKKPGATNKRPIMTSESLFRVSETANTSSHTRNCAENSDCSPTTRNIQLVKDCVVELRGLEP